MGRRRKDQASLDMVEAVEPEAVDAADMELEVVEGSVEEQEGAPVLAEEPVAAPVEMSIAHPRVWEVLEDHTVSLFGHMTLLPAGTVVSAASYGPRGVERIIEQGVRLKPIA